MKKLNLILCVIMILVTVTPAFAASEEPVGEWLDFIAHYQEFPADTPFHMDNWWTLEKDMLMDLGYGIGGLDFALEIDKALIPENYVERSVIEVDGVTYYDVHFIHNFPEGMPSGKYQFIAHWYISCHAALELGFPVECEYPNANFEFHTGRMIVEFTD